MPVRDTLPALALCVLATAALGLSRLAPAGDGPALVRLGPAGLARLAQDPALAEIRLLDLPAPGLALLRGDGARIRAAFGLALIWKGGRPCSAEP
ncbi:hypothetical protein [Paracraurococcus ruber]|uniref:Uncharacterized protein n=1 Tax=Paracraurococcus ruber TaxID=77675 RepID=A0ABS1CVX8_9PROT|nr:hypothetical protein [Paracraurococcus ruber]MBK1658192.1 hypothetical protein [Paracraurococcus ruber]TDG31821.1 hypothetical protein E2C05_09630 [Paracraurococcus ruber]